MPFFVPAGLRADVSEEEPNGTLAEANLVGLGDVVSGEVNPAGDADYFGFDAQGGTTLALEVQARQIGSPLDPTLTLLDSVGNRIAFNDDAAGLDSRIVLTIPSSGRFYAVVEAFAAGGGPGQFYRLVIAVQEPGPGDPTTLYAAGFSLPWGLAAGAEGQLYVADPDRGSVYEVTPDGSVGILTSGIGLPFALVLDGFGDLLVTDPAAGTISRVNVETGEISAFAQRDAVFPITVGPDGNVWAAARASLFRYDEEGTLLREIPLGGDVESGVIVALAFSPDGRLHLTGDGAAVYRLDGSEAVGVVEAAPFLEGLAFDRAGNLYVANGFRGEVFLYDSNYQRVGDVLARSNIGGPNNLVFLRDQSGAMTSRLLVSNWGFQLEPPYAGGIVELNPAGLSTPGFRVGVDFLRFVDVELPGATMGREYAHQVAVDDATGGETFSLEGGALPTGLTLDAAGFLSGVPEVEGMFRFTLRAERGPRFGDGEMTLVVGRPAVAPPAAADALLGVAGALSPDEERFLDLLGNHNGRLDVGDYLLFLRDGGIVASRISDLHARQARSHR